MADPESPFRIESVDGGVRFTFDVTAEPVEGQQKLARFDHFEIPCDEAAIIGGSDSAPPPLAYFASALAFWLLTQLARVGEARKIELGTVEMTVTPSFTMSGSMLAGTAAHRLDGIETDLSVTAPGVDADELAAIVDQAERMCFVLDAIERANPVVRRATINGESRS